ncbi:MAG: sigma 54-interacting transcriptional regulator [Sandaracinaceae bacterium]
MSDPTYTAPLRLQELDLDVASVTVVGGPDAGVERAFPHERLLLGTSPDAALTLTDRTVSRIHCELVPERGQIRLRDLGSKNGVWASGCRVVEALLAAGARFQIGQSTLEVRIARRRVSVPAWQGGDRLGPIVGASPAMHTLFATLERVARTDLPVLVRGESGTGKELAARAIHELSRRRSGPLVVVDGGALSRTIADSELFGHVVGAFTGAVRDREGAFGRADGGTLFLDEVAELPLETQPKLLRALQERTIKPLGADAPRRVDPRFIAATHADLPTRINAGTFREDLYFRLAAVIVEVPPLRERGGDVGLLARGFVEELAPGSAEAHALITDALEGMKGYRWPGNVRELRSFVRRTLAFGDPRIGGPTLDLDGVPRVRVDLPFAEARRRWLEAFERQYVQHVLDEAGGNVSEAARRAEVARSSFYELKERLGI